MDVEAAKTWSAALRSGKYKQCRKSITHHGKFCCLGVAHEVLVGPASVGGYAAVKEALGIDGKGPLTSGLMWRFVEMNDDEGKSFGEIADFIDEQIASQANRGTVK